MKRYSNEDGAMVPERVDQDWGDWVRYEDVKRLEQDFREATRMIEALVLIAGGRVEIPPAVLDRVDARKLTVSSFDKVDNGSIVVQVR